MDVCNMHFCRLLNVKMQFCRYPQPVVMHAVTVLLSSVFCVLPDLTLFSLLAAFRTSVC